MSMICLGMGGVNSENDILVCTEMEEIQAQTVDTEDIAVYTEDIENIQVSVEDEQIIVEIENIDIEVEDGC